MKRPTSRNEFGATRRGRRGALLVLASALALAPIASAEEAGSAWRFEVEPYAWISGIYGTVKVAGHSAKVDVDPGDLLDAVFDGNALAAAGYFSATYDRWTVFADVYGGGAKVDVDETVPTPLCNLSVNAKIKSRFVLADFALGYELLRRPLPERRQPLTVGVYTGARYMHLSNDISGGIAVVGGKRYGGSASETTDWADPLIGVRWSIPVVDSVSATFRADIGGFGASSDLDWGIVGDVRYWLSWRPWSSRPYLAAGYRVVGLDRSPNESKVDLQLSGPVAGMGFVF